jgi:hypothetical protein
LATTGYYQEPSLIFLLGTHTKLTDGPGVADFMRKGSCRYGLVDVRSERGFVQRANAIGLRYALSQHIDGYNISIGRPVAMSLFRTMATR